MHAKYDDSEVSISYSSKNIAKAKADNRQTDKHTDRQTNKQTGQKQYRSMYLWSCPTVHGPSCPIYVINQIRHLVVVVDWLFNVTINDISVIYVTEHRCAGGLKKK